MIGQTHLFHCFLLSVTESVTDHRRSREGLRRGAVTLRGKDREHEGMRSQRKLPIERNRWEGWFSKAADAVFWILENALHISHTPGGREVS